ncbi:glycoside hydrolase family 3 C-terminal domain-containing protein [Microdochium trichocladiopsis]|uniref:beta-glucosidase n=1 Tax=Microdochium trichocladiopsis TaxID=1682393 RepID=A0A9P9BUJ5_9PEZI|nr:glycoside hydrolase family 3 C-terminal domain-containing protein [Microdochium trichocladiopsis]KAH7037544.1 glycoside hydrolase family 3 C-terminal domain-containing protein [Microdochium trichocladiopsis]
MAHSPTTNQVSRASIFIRQTRSGEPFFVDHLNRGCSTSLMIEAAPGAKSARYTTRYTPPSSGNHYLSFSGIGPSKLFINGQLPYDIVIESVPSPVANSDLHLMLNIISGHIGLVTEAEMEADLLAEAVSIASSADAVICCVGSTVQWETEGQDLATRRSPNETRSQDRLIAAVAAANPRTIAWYAGQETGNAIANVLLGEVNPSGKLPVSWPRRIEDTPCYGNFGLDSYDSLEVEYVEGVFVGYRHYDQKYGSDEEVSFPFGYGLSFVTFAVNPTRIEGLISPPLDKARANNNNTSLISVTVSVRNISTVLGAETVQV